MLHAHQVPCGSEVTVHLPQESGAGGSRKSKPLQTCCLQEAPLPLLTDANPTEVTERSPRSGGSFKASNSCKMELKCLPLNALNTFCGLRLPGAAEGIGLPKSDACKGVALGAHPHSRCFPTASALVETTLSSHRALYSNPAFFSVNIFTSWEESSGGNTPRRLQRKLGAHSAASCPGSNFWGPEHCIAAMLTCIPNPSPQTAMGQAAPSQWGTVIGGGIPVLGTHS